MSLTLRLRYAGSLLSLVVLAVAPVAPAGAADFIVQPSFDDETDANPGDGVCASSRGICTLRAAVQEANAWPGPDRIIVPDDLYRLDIPGANEDLAATGDLDVRDDVTIVGESSTFTEIRNGRSGDRVFDVAPGVSVEMSGLRIALGSVSGGSGGAIENRRGIVILRDVTISGNAADGNGGGIFNGGRMTLLNTTVTENVTFGAGGGVYNQGSMTVSSATISSNAAASNGGGLYNGFPGVLVVTNSTISGNFVASFNGGGLANDSTFPGTLKARVVLSNVTVSGNSAHQNGGGVSNFFGDVLVVNGTITGNSAAHGGGVNDTPDEAGSNGTFSLANTIVARNPHGSDCGPEGLGTVRSLGHNLDSDGSCIFNGPGDLSNRNPGLGPLGFERGNSLPPPTHALLPFSPAVDRGASLCPAKDQRGLPRLVDGNGDGVARCDMGAVEFQWKEPDSCDLNGDGRYTSDDRRGWSAACVGGTRRWLCDLDGSGFFDGADIAAHDAACAPR